MCDISDPLTYCGLQLKLVPPFPEGFWLKMGAPFLSPFNFPNLKPIHLSSNSPTPYLSIFIFYF